AVMRRTAQYQNFRSAVFTDLTPDGGGLLVSTRFADTPQLHLVSMPGGARYQLTFFKEPVRFGAFDPSRGTGGFYFQMDAGGSEAYQYFWFDRATGQHTLLTDGASRNESLVVAHKGGRVAFTSTRRNKTDWDVYVLDGLDAGKTRLVKEVKGMWLVLDFSPDDSKLLLFHRVSINEGYLHVLDLKTGDTVEVNPRKDQPPVAYGTAKFGRTGDEVYYASDEGSEFLRLTHYALKSGKKTVITPNLPWDVTDVALSPDGKWIAWAANEGGRSAIYLGSSYVAEKATRIPAPLGVVSGNSLTFDRQNRRLAFSMSTSQSTADAYTFELKSRKLERWTTSEVGGLNPERFVVPKLVEYESFDGRRIPAWLYLPPKRDGKAPVVISIHGGPEGQSMAWFNWIAQYWALELGIAVIEPNVRGSSGYGRSYLLLDNADKREDSVKDIGRLLDWVAQQPELDASRVCVYGGSYGGYMVLASMAHFGDRLRCGVDVVGISNFVTFLQNTESYRRDQRRVEYGDERDPKMRAFLESISPTTNAKKIDKPLFVAQGLNDPRVPASEAEQIVKTVRTNGTPVWYLLAKDEGHGFQKKVNRDYFSNAFILFFEQYLLGAPAAPAPTKK
ncbi:MAG: S9 family peptidase, partial [Myxococcales bacterium]